MNRSRFESLLPADKLDDLRVIIVGCGNLGSHLAVALCKMGIQEFGLVDPDEVEIANLSTQVYLKCQIGTPKVTALASILKEINPAVWVVEDTKPVEDTEQGLWNCYEDEEDEEDDESVPKAIVIATTDNIESRQNAFFGGFTSIRDSSKLFVDARMSLEFLESHFIYRIPTGVDEYMKEYGKWLAAIKTTQSEPCGASSIAYTGMLAAGLICPQIRRWIIGEAIPKSIRFDCGDGHLLRIERKDNAVPATT